MYAILDIETTGGKFNEEGITEIAIYKFDGTEIVDQFISLVNPEIPIQAFVVQLTGINNAMLRSAPKFYEVAKRIVEITEDCVLVAHNSQFDYRILQNEFKRLGFDYKKNTLCTVELAKQLIPDLPSYSLGKLVKTLGIPMTDRHRASGDALATVKLFKMILSKDIEKTIVKSLIKSEKKSNVNDKLQDIINGLPTTTGVYYMHKQNGDLVYIGKSKNIRRRVNQHFTGVNQKSLRMQKEVFAVSYEETGSELIALLKESEEIKIHKPIFNRAQRKTLFLWALYAEKNAKGYLTLKIQKTDGRKKEITAFTSLQEGQAFLYKITEKHQLCQKLTGLYETKTSCFQFGIDQCKGACIEQESSQSYNERVNDFINTHRFEHENMIVVDKGRTIEEKTGVLIENGIYKGYAFFDLNYQIANLEIFKNIIIPMNNTKDALHIIKGYIKQKKVTKIIRF